MLIQELQTLKFSDIFPLPLAKTSKIGKSYKQCEGKRQTKGRSRIIIQTHMGSRGIIPAVVNLGSRQLHVPAALLPGKGPLERKICKKTILLLLNQIVQLLSWSVVQ